MVDMGAMGNQALGWLVTAIIIFFSIVLAVGLTFLVLYIKRYRTKVYIWHKDSMGNLSVKMDMGGTYTDKKSKMKLFFLKDHKVGLKADNIPYITWGKKKENVVWLYQHGLKNFTYVTPKVSNPSFELSCTEEDLNWYIHDRAKIANIFHNMMMQQIMALALWAFVIAVILVLVIYVLKQFSVLKDVAEALRQTAGELAKAKAGTVVVGG